MSAWQRWVRFNAVGGLGIVVQLAVITTAIHLAGVHYLVATTVGVAVAIGHNFAWHVWWTWRDRADGALAWRFAQFAGLNGLISLGGNAAVMTLLVGGAGWPIVPSNLLAIVTCGLANYWLTDRVVFA